MDAERLYELTDPIFALDSVDRQGIVNTLKAHAGRCLPDQARAYESLAFLVAESIVEGQQSDAPRGRTELSRWVLLRRLREEVRDWQDAVGEERPSLGALCAEIDEALA